MHRTLLGATTVAIVLSSTLTASAQVITFNFTGTISPVSGGPRVGPFVDGQTVSGSFTFESVAVDQDPSLVVGLYENVTSFNISIPDAGYFATASPGSRPGFVEVLDNQDGMRDRYVVSMTAPDQSLSGTPVAGATLNRLAIVLRDRTTLALSSDALPLVPPSLSAFPDGTFFLGFSGGFGSTEMGGTLTSLTLAETTVPDQIEALAETINALELGGTINGGQAGRLGATLDRALALITNDRPRAAAQLLRVFRLQVLALVLNGSLTFAQGGIWFPTH
jgi:hypothetical protein